MPESTRKRVTAADIARSLGVSRATVGFVLNDTPGQTISPVTRQRVLDEAERLGYRPHLAARTLASGQSRIVLLVLPDWPVDYSLRAYLDEASLALDEAGYSLVTMTPHPQGHARPLWETLQPDLVLGLVPFDDEQARAMRAAGAKVISPGQVSPAVDSQVGRDLEHALGPQLQIEHLVERGHRSLVFATTDDRRLERLAAERADLASAAAARLGVALTVAPVGADSARSSVARWIADRVTAVAAYNDDIAALVVGAALRSDTAVPGRLAVIGHDDTPLAERFVPAISSIHVDTAGLGRYLADLALSSIEGTPPPAAPPTTRATLVARETT